MCCTRNPLNTKHITYLQLIVVNQSYFVECLPITLMPYYIDLIIRIFFCVISILVLFSNSAYKENMKKYIRVSQSCLPDFALRPSKVLDAIWKSASKGESPTDFLLDLPPPLLSSVKLSSPSTSTSSSSSSSSI